MAFCWLAFSWLAFGSLVFRDWHFGLNGILLIGIWLIGILLISIWKFGISWLAFWAEWHFADWHLADYHLVFDWLAFSWGIGKKSKHNIRQLLTYLQFKLICHKIILLKEAKYLKIFLRIITSFFEPKSLCFLFYKSYSPVIS